MRFRINLILLIFLVLVIPAYGTAQVNIDEMTADEILNYVDDLYRGDSAQGTMTMKIQTEHWKRELTMDTWSLGKDKSLYRILAPLKEKGTATLKNGNDIWNYLPKVKRTIKLPSSMMSQSWMGSHFTNDDLVKDSRFADDYTFEKTFDGVREKRAIYEITCIPKPTAAVVWGKVVLTVLKENYIPLDIFYYNEDMKLTRTMSFSDEKNFGRRLLPSVVTIIPSDKPNESTTVIYDDVLFDAQIDESIFSLRNLER